MVSVLGMQELQYLNIAINNITRIENLHRCESLSRLDMTMNFVDKSAIGSIDNLRGLISLRELHLLGNPCTQWSRYREYVIVMLPQLQLLVRHELKGHACMLVSLPSDLSCALLFVSNVPGQHRNDTNAGWGNHHRHRAGCCPLQSI